MIGTAGAVPPGSRLAEAAREVGVHDRRVLAAVRAVRRAAFVPPEYAWVADVDEPIPIPHQQLRPGGRLVQPIGPGGAEQVTLFERTPEGLVERERLLPARFVRLHGRYGYR